jgi:hypothetical protein
MTEGVAPATPQLGPADMSAIQFLSGESGLSTSPSGLHASLRKHKVDQTLVRPVQRNKQTRPAALLRHLTSAPTRAMRRSGYTPLTSRREADSNSARASKLDANPHNQDSHPHRGRRPMPVRESNRSRSGSRSRTQHSNHSHRSGVPPRPRPRGRRPRPPRPTTATVFW